MDYVHVISAASVKAVVRDGAPKVAPRFARSDQERSDDLSLLLYQKFQSIFVV